MSIVIFRMIACAPIFIFLLLRFLVSSVYGVFIISVILYVFSYELFGVEPFTFIQLIDWFSIQSEGTKSAIISSTITIIGFLIAYATASYNLKAQALSQLRLQAASEINAYLELSSKLIVDCKIYADSILNAVEKIKSGSDERDVDFLINYHREQTLLFLQNKQKLISLSIDAYRLQGRYSDLLSLNIGLNEKMNKVTELLSLVVNKIYFMNPVYPDGAKVSKELFMAYVDVSACELFSNTVSQNIGEINSIANHIRWRLQFNVVSLNFSSLVSYIRVR